MGLHRTAIAICLPADEYQAVGRELAEAGYDPVRIASPDDLETLLSERQVSLAILDGEADFDSSIEMYALLHEGQRDIPVLMVVSSDAVEHLSQAARSRVNGEFVTRPFSASSLRWRVEAMLIRAETMLIRSLGDEIRTPLVSEGSEIRQAVATIGQIVVVFNPKGGVGKTTMAVNTAAALQLRKGQRVLLIDCDTVTGHISTSLGMGQVPTLVGTWTRDLRTDPGFDRPLVEIATRHANGISVLVMSSSPLHTEVLEPRRVAQAIALARDSFDWVIVDMHPDYGPLNQAIFAMADQILVPVTPDVPTIRAAVQFREVSCELQIRDRLALIVNRSNSGVSAGDIEKVVQVGALARVRSAGMIFVKAANEGRSAVELFPQARVVSDIEKLAGSLMAVRDAGAEGVESLGGSGSIRNLLGRLTQNGVNLPRLPARAR